MNKPKISFIVVTNGPVATAGSTLNFFNKSGIVAPRIVAKIIIHNRERESIIVKTMLSKNIIVITNKILLIVNPFNTETRNSLPILIKAC